MLAYAINNCRPTLLVIDSKYIQLLESVSAELQTVEQILILGEGVDETQLNSTLTRVIRLHQIRHDVSAARDAMIDPQANDIACIPYTSGTTGPSKADLLPWGELPSIDLGTFPYKALWASVVFYCNNSHAP